MSISQKKYVWEKKEKCKGDMNVDLLKPNKNNHTDNFINTIYSLGFFPKIIRLSRTTHSATLNHSILTNVLEDCSRWLFKNALLKQIWYMVYKVQDIDLA